MLQSDVEYEYFADRFSVRCQTSFAKVRSLMCELSFGASSVQYGRQLAQAV